MKTFKNHMKSLLGRRNTNEEIIIHDATGKPMKISNVKFRGADGKLHSAPPGKSRSSER